MNNQPFKVQQAYTATHYFEDDGVFPNNEKLALVIYMGAFHLLPEDSAEKIEQVFESYNWTNGWRDGVYTYHHYHSTAHEVLGIYCGTAKIQLGGPKGVIVEVTRGDVLVIPAGVAHKNLECSEDFRCVGAYPDGQQPDINYGESGERLLAFENIRTVPLPLQDPVYGDAGAIKECWL